jgi:hypothetical protein
MIKKKISFLIAAFSILLASCSPPSMENVTISNDYRMRYDYYAYRILNVDYDIYWPILEINNESNREATITFNYSFYVCGIRQTSSSLNKTVNYLAPKGISNWELDLNSRMTIRSDATCNGRLITVSLVDFDWEVVSVS